MTRPDSNRIILEKSELSILTLHDVSIAKLSGEVLARHIDERISLGERVLINCNMFTGAKLFRAIAGLRPWGSGRIELPDDNTLFFMPPRPYLPKGSLRSAICYPSDDNVFNDEQIIEAMELSGVHELIEQLDQQGEWAKILSRETQQRLGLVRLLLYRPQWIFMQTAFDSLDAEGEEQVLRLICQQLPNSAMLTITNLETAGAFHHRRIILD